MFRSRESPVRVRCSSRPSSSTFRNNFRCVDRTQARRLTARPQRGVCGVCRGWRVASIRPAARLLSTASLQRGHTETVAREGALPHAQSARDARQRLRTDPVSACSAATPGSRHRCDLVPQIRKHQLCPLLASRLTPGLDLNPDPGISVARCPSGDDRGRQGRWPGRQVGGAGGQVGGRGDGRVRGQASVQLSLHGCYEA